MKITKRSTFSGNLSTRDIDITERQLRNWMLEGKMIQDAMPHLSADDREFLISGTTPEEWDEMIGNKE